MYKCTSPQGNAYVEGLTSDPEQRRGFSITRRQTQCFTQISLPMQTEGHIYHKGCANAQSVPEELLSDGHCLLSTCCCHWLITSHHSPFASQLIQSSKPSKSLHSQYGKKMHWLNMSAQTAGTEVMIQNIKQHCRKKYYLLSCTSENVTSQCQ